MPALPSLLTSSAPPKWLKWENFYPCDEAFYRNFVRLRLAFIFSLGLVLACAAFLGKMSQVYFFCLSLEGDMGMDAAAIALLLVPNLCYLLLVVSDRFVWFIRDAFARAVLEKTRRHIIAICSALVPGVRPSRRTKNAVDLLVLACVEVPVVAAAVSSILSERVSVFASSYIRASAFAAFPIFLWHELGEVCASSSPSMAARLDALALAPTNWNLGSSLFRGPGEDWETGATARARGSDGALPRGGSVLSEGWTAHVATSIRTIALFWLSGNALFALNVLLVGIHRSSIAGFAVFLVIVLLIGVVRRRLFPGVGPLYRSLINFGLLLSLGFIAGSLIQAREGEATTIGTRLIGGAGANYTGVRRPDAYPICDRRWGNASLPEERRLAVLDFLLLTDAMYSGSAESIDQYVREGTAGTALADVERVDLEDYSVVSRMAVFRFPSMGVQVLSARGTQITKEFLKDVDAYLMTTILQVAEAFIPALSFMTDEMVQNYMYYLSVYNFIEDPTVERVVRRLQDLKEDGDSRGYATIATGHSLGGMLAAVAAIRVGTPAVVFSTPGLVFNAKVFGLGSGAARATWTNIFHVQPADDVVASLDTHLGQMQRVACSKRSFLACHLSPTTICELFERCGDPRGRTLGGPGFGASWCAPD